MPYYTTELYEMVNKYKYELIGNYENVKKSTPIYIKCCDCGIQIKKSYGLLQKRNSCYSKSEFLFFTLSI